jgi:hypothetical protein
VTLTPQQKDAICNPNNPLSKLNPVNTTESRNYINAHEILTLFELAV